MLAGETGSQRWRFQALTCQVARPSGRIPVREDEAAVLAQLPCPCGQQPKERAYLESKEYLGGFWVIDVPDLDAALGWAREAAVACRQPLEVRPFMEEPPQGA